MARKSYHAPEKDTNVAMLPVSKAKGASENKLFFAERIRTLRISANLSQAELSRKVGVSPAAVYHWETARARPDIAIVPALCRALNISTGNFFSEADVPQYSPEEQLLVGKYRLMIEPNRRLIEDMATRVLDLQEDYSVTSKKRKDCRKLPILGVSAAAGVGDPSEWPDDTDRISVFNNRFEIARADCVVNVNGDSMEPTFPDGSQVYVQLSKQRLHPGEIGIFQIGNEVYIKEFQNDGLHSHNKSYATMHAEEYPEITLIGRVLGLVRREDIAD